MKKFIFLSLSIIFLSSCAYKENKSKEEVGQVETTISQMNSILVKLERNMLAHPNGLKIGEFEKTAEFKERKRKYAELWLTKADAICEEYTPQKLIIHVSYDKYLADPELLVVKNLDFSFFTLGSSYLHSKRGLKFRWGIPTIYLNVVDESGMQIIIVDQVFKLLPHIPLNREIAKEIKTKNISLTMHVHFELSFDSNNNNFICTVTRWQVIANKDQILFDTKDYK